MVTKVDYDIHKMVFCFSQFFVIAISLLTTTIAVAFINKKKTECISHKEGWCHCQVMDVPRQCRCAVCIESECNFCYLCPFKPTKILEHNRSIG